MSANDDRLVRIETRLCSLMEFLGVGVHGNAKLNYKLWEHLTVAEQQKAIKTMQRVSVLSEDLALDIARRCLYLQEGAYVMNADMEMLWVV